MNKFDANAPATKKLLKVLHSWQPYAFYLLKLPTVWFWGVKIKKVSPQRCELKLPYRWSSKNPFNSLYFAAQCGAAELSTGILARIALEGRGKISMLVSEVKAEFSKKATNDTFFVCEEGDKIIAAVDKAVETGEGQTVTVQSVGKMADGTVTSITTLTWTFLAKKIK